MSDKEKLVTNISLTKTEDNHDIHCKQTQIHKKNPAIHA